MRRGKPKKREVAPDPKYNDPLVTKFVNQLMRDGKKTVAFRIFYEAIDIIGKRLKDELEKEGKTALDVWKEAMENVTPQVEVKSRRIGGATFQVPMEVRPDRKRFLGIKHIIMFARKRHGKPMAQRLADEIIAAYRKEGGAYKRKEDIHRMAEANKAFAHFKF